MNNLKTVRKSDARPSNDDQDMSFENHARCSPQDRRAYDDGVDVATELGESFREGIKQFREQKVN